MASKDEEKSLFPLLDGCYKAAGTWYSSIVFDGHTAAMKGSNGSSHQINFKVEEFGETDSEIAEKTGQKFYNIELSYSFGKDFSELGVVSEDGLQITMKGMMGIAVLKWITEEEAAALEEEGDPIEAPPGPYKIQPENVGKFLWITGAPGLGKSTSAQLLCRTAGFVYYEADCFGSCRNPFIPPDVVNPSLAQVYQKPLKGVGLKERREVCKKSEEVFGKIIIGEDFDVDAAKEFYGAMCDDINIQRKRIGGDWAIAAVTLSRDLRDFIRSKLGPDLVFVCLNMKMEHVVDRLNTRHKGHEGMVDMLKSVNKWSEAAAEDEEQAVNVNITKEMSMEEVINKILDVVYKTIS